MHRPMHVYQMSIFFVCYTSVVKQLRYCYSSVNVVMNFTDFSKVNEDLIHLIYTKLISQKPQN